MGFWPWPVHDIPTEITRWLSGCLPTTCITDKYIRSVIHNIAIAQWTIFPKCSFPLYYKCTSIVHLLVRNAGSVLLTIGTIKLGWSLDLPFFLYQSLFWCSTFYGHFWRKGRLNRSSGTSKDETPLRHASEFGDQLRYLLDNGGAPYQPPVKQSKWPDDNVLIIIIRYNWLS